MKSIFTFFITLISISTIGQKTITQSVTKSYSYSRQIKPGTEMLDDNGNRIRQEKKYDYLLFIETKGSVKPVWKLAWINGKPYDLHISEVDGAVDLGKK